MGKRDHLQYLLVLATDSLCLLISSVGSWLFLDSILKVILDYPVQDIFRFFLLLALAFLVTCLGLNQSGDVTKKEWKGQFYIAIKNNLLIGAVLAVSLLVAKVALSESRYLYGTILIVNTLLQFAAHSLLKRGLEAGWFRGSWETLTGIITTQDRAEPFVRGIQSDWSKSVQGIVLVDAEPAIVGSTIRKVPVVATFDDFMDWVRRDSLDEIYINIPYATGESLRPYVSEMESMGLVVHLNVPTLECYMVSPRETAWVPHLRKNLDEVAGIPLATVAGNQQKFHELVLKRMMDIVGAIVGMVISVPIIAITALPLKLESRGPLFFKQQRVGRNGRVFYIYKLRSMYVDAEQRKKDLLDKNEMQGFMFKMENDPRVTKVGRFIRRTSIDELPQFWNVLKGEMSLVGTRPPTLDEYERYESHHKRRLSMKPGLTGLWQVSGRSDIENFEDVVKLDVQYIDNWSLKQDILILIKTVAVVFAGIGAK